MSEISYKKFNDASNIYELNAMVEPINQVQDINAFLEMSGKIRILLHNTLYNDDRLMESFLGLIRNLDLFSVEYNKLEKTLKLKIKKTNIKKSYNDFEHCCIFYYDIFNDLFLRFFSDHIEALQNIFVMYGLQYNINFSANYLLDINIIRLIYRIVSILDNVLIIYL